MLTKPFHGCELKKIKKSEALQVFFFFLICVSLNVLAVTAT